MNKVKLAIFGANQGARIARVIKDNNRCDFIALAGFGKQAEDTAEELGVDLYPDYHDLLEKVPVDAVVIALPNDLHLEATKACIDAGVKNILVEKPIAGTLEDGEELNRICKESGTTLLVGHHRRSANTFLFLKDFISQGYLGDIVAIHCSYALNKNLDYWEDEWHKKATGGPLLVNAIHDFDDLNNVLGLPPKRVYAVKRNSIRGNEAEDSASALIEYENGPVVTYFVSDGTPSLWNYDLLGQADERFAWETGDNSMRIFGTKGSFGFPNMDFYTYKDKEHWGWNYPLIKEHFGVEFNNPLISEMNHFFDLCLGIETVPRCSGDQALLSLKLITAVLESCRTGQVVDIK